MTSLVQSTRQHFVFLVVTGGLMTLLLASNGCDTPTPTKTGTSKSGTSNLSFGDIVSAVAPKTKDGWHQSFGDAQAEAKSSGRPLLIDFTGSDWCHWCIKLDEEVFEASEFKEWAEKNVVLLKLDFPQSVQQEKDLVEQNRAMQQVFAIRGFPTVIFVDSSGKLLGRYGYDKGGPKNWISKAESMIR
ncbi:MAG: thioredoxin family protein [Pirellulaceae bacterium]